MMARSADPRHGRHEVETGKVQWERAVAACVRALSEDPALRIVFVPGHERRAGPTLDPRIVRVPQQTLRANAMQLAAVRGCADAASLWRVHHDPDLHMKWAPVEGDARIVFDALERIRTEALGALTWLGVALNLAARRAALHDAGNAARDDYEGQHALVEYVIAFAWTSLMPGQSSVQRTATGSIDSMLMDATRALSRAIRDQFAFAEHSLALIRRLGLDEASDPDAGGDDMLASSPQQLATDSAIAVSREDETNRSTEALTGSTEAVDIRQDIESTHDENIICGYRAYTSVYDEVVRPCDLVGANDLADLRRKLDRTGRTARREARQVGDRLRREWMTRRRMTWESGHDEGQLDPAYLTRIVTSPLQSPSYRIERNAGAPDAVVTLLIDHSHSMLPRSLTVVAACVDILAVALEQCDVKVEVLGFTTRTWDGGRPRAQWLAQARPSAPGRLNELRHIVYKPADMPWRRARIGFGLMLRDDLPKENIDGEALLWAHARLLARRERRRLLVMISDGVPADESTLTENAANYLEQHLREAIGEIEARSAVELFAIGIGHEVDRYYRNAVTVTGEGDLARELASTFASWLATTERRAR